MRHYSMLFLVMLVWDLAATLAVRYIADQNLAAIPVNAVLALFWWASIISLRRNLATACVIMGAAGAGTALGLYFSG